MASRTTTTIPLIALSDLSTCTDAANILALFRRLRYPVEPEAVAVPMESGDLPESLREGIAARYLIARVSGARRGAASVDVTLFALGDPAQALRARRRAQAAGESL